MNERTTLIRQGVIGVVVVLIVVAAIVGHRSIPLVSTDGAYSALFSDASALNTGDAVEVAGSKVGEVSSIELEGDHVRVGFTMSSHTDLVGADSTAAIKVATLLGRRYLELTPQGRCCMSTGATIPLARTSSGYDITDSLSQVAADVKRTDLDSLESALDTTAELAERVSPDLRPSLDGLRRLSESIASRDESFRDLLGHAGSVTAILAKRNTQLLSLFTQGNSLLAALNARSADIHGVLVEGRRVAAQLSALTRENEATLGPALSQFQTTLDTLNANYDNINKAITGAGNFTTQLGEIVASGPFFSALLQNVLPATLDGQSFLSPGAPH